VKRIGKWLVFLLLAGTLCGCKKEDEVTEVTIRSYDAEVHGSKEYKMENEYLVCEMDPETTYFTVTQKSNGKVWYSNPVDGANDVGADAAAKRNLQSTLIVENSTVNGINVAMNNFEYSITDGRYELEKVEGATDAEDAVRVMYTVGKVAKTYYIPLAVPEARMQEFMDKMDSSQKRKIDDYYRRYDINNLFATDDKAALLKQYPDLETTRVYVLRSTLQQHMLKKTEELFASVGYTKEDYELDKARYDLESDNGKAVIDVTVVYRLDGNKLVVEIPHDEIEYKTAYPITKITILPYFGAGGSTEDGYLVVPEGSGAVINFNNGKSEQSAYYADVYGWDYILKRDAIVNETRVSIPVFGVAHEDGAFLAIMEDYASVAAIEADVSGRRHSYNTVYATYELLHSEQMDISAKSDRTVLSFEKKLPKGSTVQSYTFIDNTEYGEMEDAYVKMAEVYRDYMMEKYPTLQKLEETELPVVVELIGAIDRIKQILGIPLKRPDVLTSFAEAKTMIKEMLAAGYENLSIRYSGWMNGGVTHSIPKDIDLNSGMGGKSDLKDLMSYANSNNVDVYLSGHVQSAYESNFFDGFVASRDAAKHISRDLAKLYVYSNIYFGEMPTDRHDSYYLLRPSVCVQLMQNLADEAAKYKAGVGFEDVGYLLSSDYNSKKTVTREQSMKMQQEALSKIEKSGTPIMLTNGNEYAIAYADIITNVDLAGKSNKIFDYMIPFYEIALHGLINYTGDAVNLTGNVQDAILKSAETGAGLYFTFMHASSDELQNTEYMDYFAADYAQWKEDAKEYYLRYKKEMAGLNNQYITDHTVIADGVTATTYEDGTVVYVNYNTVDYKAGTLLVKARDYLVERSGN